MKLEEFLKGYFNSTFNDFQRELSKSGEKEAFLKAFIAGFEFNPHITLDLDDDIVEIMNRPRNLPVRIKQFIEEWKTRRGE